MPRTPLFKLSEDSKLMGFVLLTVTIVAVIVGVADYYFDFI